MPRGLEREIKILQEKEKNIEKLKILVESLAEKMRGEGVPVTKDCRIDMDGFKEVYPLKFLDRDKEEIKNREAEWLSELSKLPSGEREKAKKNKEKADQLEMLKTVIFAKFLGEEYLSVRTSLYDDYVNHADNVILEKKTGNLACALDEVGDMEGPTYEKKTKDVLGRNIYRKGVSLKYGLKFEQGKLRLGKTEKAPIFYLALKDLFIEKGIRELTSLEKKSDFEKKLFEYFIISLGQQINRLYQLERLGEKLDPFLKERLKQFEKTLEKFK